MVISLFTVNAGYTWWKWSEEFSVLQPYIFDPNIWFKTYYTKMMKVGRIIIKKYYLVWIFYLCPRRFYALLNYFLLIFYFIFNSFIIWIWIMLYIKIIIYRKPNQLLIIIGINVPWEVIVCVNYINICRSI